jgi:hypothetical protein
MRLVESLILTRPSLTPCCLTADLHRLNRAAHNGCLPVLHMHCILSDNGRQHARTWQLGLSVFNHPLSLLWGGHYQPPHNFQLEAVANRQPNSATT